MLDHHVLVITNQRFAAQIVAWSSPPILGTKCKTLVRAAWQRYSSPKGFNELINVFIARDRLSPVAVYLGSCFYVEENAVTAMTCLTDSYKILQT